MTATLDGVVHGAHALLRAATAGALNLAAACLLLLMAACGGSSGDDGPAATAPAITTQPAAASVEVGQTASFSVVASGTAPLTYQWQRNGTAITGATSATYTTPAVTRADDGAAYSVVVSNSAGSVTSATALLTAVAAQAPTLSAQPADASVVAPATATFTVQAQGSAPLAYQWQRNGAAIAGATSASYITPATALADSGARFSVLVSNAAGSITSDEAELTVTESVVAPSITTGPVGLTVLAGQPAQFSVSASGTAPLAYQWRRNGSDIPGATAAQYTLATTVAGDDGAAFSVVVSNAAGSVTSNAAVLRIDAGGAGAFPTRSLTLIVPVAAGAAADTTARALASSLGAALGQTVSVRNVTSNSGATAMQNLAAAAADGYTLLLGRTVMSSFEGRGTSLDDFEALGLIIETPLLIAGRRDLPAADHATLTSWIAGQPAGSVKLSTQGSPSASELCGRLFFQQHRATPTIVPYAGSAPALVDLLAGVNDLLCTEATPTIGDRIAAGTLRGYGLTSRWSSPLATLAGVPTLDASGLPGFDVTEWLGLHAPSGTPAAVLDRLNSALREALADPEFVRRIGPDGARVVEGARLGRAGHASFVAAEIARWGTLLAGEPAVVAPSITNQPLDVTVSPGAAATFSVIATGTAPLTYQWRRNGSDIAGATAASYTTPVTTLADDGATFSVIVRNAHADAATSAAATLRVVNVPGTTLDALFRSRNCMACHAPLVKLLGPSWQQVAGRYAGRSDQEAYLVDRIRLGGVGAWGQVPMPSTAQVTVDEATQMARWFIGGAP